MGLACNINRKGRWFRAVSGVLVIAVAGGIALADSSWSPTLRWAIAGVLALLGAFQIFEASMGWCAVRALGFRTPI